MTNCNSSVIPFYDSRNEQSFRLWYSFGEKYPLFVPRDYLVPFFHIVPHIEGATIMDAVFYQVCCNEEPKTGTGDFSNDFSNDFEVLGDSNKTFHQILTSNGLSIIRNSDYDIISYHAVNAESLNLRNGVFYLAITYGTSANHKTYYSDLFFVGDMSNLVKVEWWCEENLPLDKAYIPYNVAFKSRYFKQVMYVDTTIGKPDYVFTEEGEERDGYFFPMKQISEKEYHFGFLAPEFLCDAMRLIRLSDAVRVTDQFGRIYNVEHFETESNWTEQGYLAEVSCTFQTDTIVKKVGKAYYNITDR